MKARLLVLLLLVMPLTGCEEDPEDDYGHQTRPFVLMEQHVQADEPAGAIVLCGALMALFLCTQFKRKIFT